MVDAIDAIQPARGAETGGGGRVSDDCAEGGAEAEVSLSLLYEMRIRVIETCA